MNPAAGQVEQGGDRLARFRGLMSRLDPAGDPARAVDADLYLPSARAASSRIAARLALSPASTHLLVGGVGSGKTTELLAVQRRLGKLSDTRAIYVDVSKAHDMGSFVPGVVVVQVGLALAAALPATDENEGVVSAEQSLRILADGYFSDGYDGEGDERYYHVPGILVSPDQFAENVSKARKSIVQILAALRARWQHIVVLIDGLDRLTTAYVVYLIHPDVIKTVEAELKAELAAYDEGLNIQTIESSLSAARLLQDAPSILGDVLLVGAEAYTEADWRLLDRRRSEFARDGVTVVLTSSGELLHAHACRPQSCKLAGR